MVLTWLCSAARHAEVAAATSLRCKGRAPAVEVEGGGGGAVVNTGRSCRAREREREREGHKHWWMNRKSGRKNCGACLQEHGCSFTRRFGYARYRPSSQCMGHALQYIAAAVAKKFAGAEQRVNAGGGRWGGVWIGESAGKMR